MKAIAHRHILCALGALIAANVYAQDTGSVLTDMPSPEEISAAVERANPKVDRSPPSDLQIKSYQRRELSPGAQARLAANRQIAFSTRLDYVPDSYQVTFEEGVFPYLYSPERSKEYLIDREGFTLEETADTLMSIIGGEVRRIHTSGHGGFSAVLTHEQAQLVAAMAGIASITRTRRGNFLSAPTWTQDRINQRSSTLDSNYTTMTDSGTSVHIYIIDSGVRGTHQEFSGRIGTGEAIYFSGNQAQAYTDVTGASGGHGTLVAGMAAGATYGIAQDAIIHSVRITDGSGFWDEDDAAAGIDWVRLNFSSPAVANISFEILPNSSTVDSATVALINAGVTTVVAAGNSNSSNVGDPAGVTAAITVGATDDQDARWVSHSTFGSNYGIYLDLFAPGYIVEGPIASGDAVFGNSYGTSFASPIVAGIAALYLKGHPSATPEAVRNSIVANSTRGVVTNAGGGSRPDLAYANPDWLDTDELIVGGSGSVVNTNVTIGSNVVDHVLLTGTTVTVHPDNGQIVRVSWIDEDDDIVFAEMAGPGNLQISLENSSGPALPTKYDQAVYYMKGRASFEIIGATASTYFNVFSVGTANTSDQSIFLPVQYDGIADIKNLGFLDTASIGGILHGNAVYQGSSGIVGIFPGPWPAQPLPVKITNRLSIRDIKASGTATPTLIFHPDSQIADYSGKPIIGGGDLIQPNGDKIGIRDGFAPGFQALITNANVDSHGNTTPPLPLSSARLGYQYSSTIIQVPYSTTEALGYTPPSPGYTSAY